MSVLPLLSPTLVVGVVLATVLCRRLGRALDQPWWASWLLVAGLALVVALTLTPQREATGTLGPFTGVDPFASVAVAEVPVGANLWRWPWEWALDDRTLNIAIFVPLGVAVGLVGRRGWRWMLTVVVLALPLVIEGAQYLVSWLQRDSQWQDVADNLTGAVVGLVAGTVVRVVLDRRARR